MKNGQLNILHMSTSIKTLAFTEPMSFISIAGLCTSGNKKKGEKAYYLKFYFRSKHGVGNFGIENSKQTFAYSSSFHYYVSLFFSSSVKYMEELNFQIFFFGNHSGPFLWKRSFNSSDSDCFLLTAVILQSFV